MSLAKIFVVAPAGHATGGVEALHQLVDALLRLGIDAYVAYWPPHKQSAVTAEYSGYRIRVGVVEDRSSNVIVVPEAMFSVHRQFRRARVAIWWLSIDFYLGRGHRSRLEDAARLALRVVTGRVVPFGMIRGLMHFAQSCYARDYLAKFGIRASMLSDYLNEGLLPQGAIGVSRLPVVLYNPAKGVERTRRIIAATPSVEFVPIRGYSRVQVLELFRGSAVYVDFGHHPGKDRMPREAAVNGCVVITNRRGSARNDMDVPLPSDLKIDDDEPRYDLNASHRLREVLESLSHYQIRMAEYVRMIHNERATFDSEVEAAVRGFLV